MMNKKVSPVVDRDTLLFDYRRVRAFTEILCEPLAIDDFQIQSIPQTSPPKWHIAHVTWFFETLVLLVFDPSYKVYREDFDFIFNSYYYTHGKMHPRPMRGLLSRPTVNEILEYRHHVDQKISALIENLPDTQWDALLFLVTLGIHHEQQHQELLLMDVKHNFFINPLKPAYRHDLVVPEGKTRPLNWVDIDGGIYNIGHGGDDFCFDNETPQHEVLLRQYRLSDRFITNGEYQAFIDDGAYSNPALWLSDGWTLIHREGWQHPLYWLKNDNGWQQFTLDGVRELGSDEPVCHLSFYEADAYARWAGKRLPLEAELEIILAQQPVAGNFVDDDLLHPASAGERGQWFGDLWAWTASPYTAFPGFKPLQGIIGEYNGKFMANQMVLRGGSCVTLASHTRATYRNFFYPEERWAFTGLRLAEDV